jgi:polar amino acid transport system substrate-binding protein
LASSFRFIGCDRRQIGEPKRKRRKATRGPGDLPGKAIAATPATIAGDYLTQHGLPFTPVANPDEGIRMLKQGDVQAVVLSAAVLQYMAAKLGDRTLQVVGPIFRPYKNAAGG